MPIEKDIHPQAKTIRISGQHMNVGQAFKTHIEDKLEALITKYYEGHYDGHVTLAKTGSGYSADCLIHLDSGIILQTAEQGDDPRQIFDQAAERMEIRLKRYKERLTSRRRKQSDYKFLSNHTHHIMATPAEEDLNESFSPAVIAEKTVSFPQMSVAEAALELDLIDNPLILFRSRTNEKLNIVYRRSDGNIGWVEP